jgi:DNA-binding transcriptional LysR family regulator
MISERQINAFRHVMRLGSVTAAARAMSVSQPAISRTIAELEADLGLALFERRAGKLFATNDARCLAGEADRMFYGLERLDSFARELRSLHHSTLSVATLPTISFRILPRVLASFVRNHKGVRVTHNVHDSPRIVDLVAAGQVDVGLVQLAAGRRDAARLASWRSLCVVVLPAGHPLAGRKSLGPQDLEDEPLVALSSQTLTAGHISDRFAEAGVVARIAVESQPSFAACGLVAEGAGVAIVDPFTPMVFAPGTLSVVPFAPEVPFDLHLIAHAQKALSRAAQVFADALTAELDVTPFTERIAT